MHEQILASFHSLGCLVLLCRKSPESVTIHECPQSGFYLCHQYVNPQIKLPSVDQVWLLLILLNYVAFISWNVLYPTGQEDAFALARVLRFHYKGQTLPVRPALCYEVVKVEKFIGSYPSLREEFEVLWETLLHQL